MRLSRMFRTMKHELIHALDEDIPRNRFSFPGGEGGHQPADLRGTRRRRTDAGDDAPLAPEEPRNDAPTKTRCNVCTPRAAFLGSPFY